MKDLGYGKDYAYDHNTPDSFSGQNYFPDDLERPIFYQPKGQGFEEIVLEKLNRWQKLREELKTNVFPKGGKGV
jgi:putative ATPase